MFKVTFSARVVNQDTEEEFTGWVSPEWSMWTLYTRKDDVTVNVFNTREEAVMFIEETIGSVETDCGELVTGNYYAADARMSMQSGEEWLYCGHVKES